MLYIKDCIGIEYKKQGGKNKGSYKVYLFKCSTINCSNMVKSRKSYFNKHSGICIHCSAKKNY